MKIIGLNDIASLNLPKELYYKWAKEVFLNKNTCVLPAKTSLKWYDGITLTKPSPS